jgi:teichuronic acid biosynthesis glycosyltransferase TuaG
MLKKKSIKIDIILPNYNSNKFIKETINSILNQSFKNWRLIIVDDNSNLDNKKILKKYSKNSKIKIIWLKKNKGAGFCRNMALNYSKANYIAFIDSDDIWYKSKLSDQLKFMLKNNFDFTYTNYLTFEAEDNLSKKHKILDLIKPPKKFNFNQFVKNTSIATCTMLIKRKLVKGVKFTNTKICEDYYFKCKVLKKINYAYFLTKTLSKYRIRSDSMQSSKLRNFTWIWYINKHYNKFSFYENFISLVSISLNSIKKYGFK